MSALIKKLGLLLAATIAGLALVELLCRLCLPSWAPPKAQEVNFWQYDALLGWKHQPLKEGRFQHRDFSTHVAINSLGLRDEEYPVARMKGKKRFLLLGDSFGWGYGVEQDETIDALLESRYRDIEFINASVAGYGTDQQYLYLKNHGVKFHPDLVMVLFHPNDVHNNTHAKQYDYDKPVFEAVGGELVLRNTPVPHRLSGGLRRLVLNRTYFPRKVYLASRRLSSGNDRPEAKEPAFDVTEALLLETRKVAAANGAELWLVGIPWRHGEPGKTVERIRDFARPQGIRYVSLKEAFDGAARPTRYPHTQHWNAYGHELAADAIERALRAAGYLASES